MFVSNRHRQGSTLWVEELLATWSDRMLTAREICEELPPDAPHMVSNIKNSIGHLARMGKIVRCVDVSGVNWAITESSSEYQRLKKDAPAVELAAVPQPAYA